MPAGRVITVLESKLTHLLSCKLILISCIGVGILPVFLTVSSTQIVFPGSKTLSSTSHAVWRKSLTDHKGHCHYNGFYPHPCGSCHHFHDTHHYRAPNSSPWASRAIIFSRHVIQACVRFPKRIRVSSDIPMSFFTLSPSLNLLYFRFKLLTQGRFSNRSHRNYRLE